MRKAVGFSFAVGLLFFALPASAQSVGATVGPLWTEHRDLASALGAQVELTFGFVTIAVEHAWQDHERGVQYCGGLVPPGADCSLKQSDITSRLTSLLIGAGAERNDINLRASFGFTHLAADWTSLVTADALRDVDQNYLVLGIDGHYAVGLTSTLSLTLGASGRYFFAPDIGECIDCAPRQPDSFAGGGVRIGLQQRFRWD